MASPDRRTKPLWVVFDHTYPPFLAFDAEPDASKYAAEHIDAYVVQFIPAPAPKRKRKVKHGKP